MSPRAVPLFGYGDLPVPILSRDIRDEPRQPFAVEYDVITNAALDQPVGIDEVAVEFETGVV